MVDRRAPIVIALAACVACGEIIGASGEETPPAPPGAADGQAAGDADATSFDGSGDDASVGLDGGGGDADAAPTSTFCSLGSYTFCADFDEPGVYAPPWDDIALNPQIKLDSSASVSAPASFLIDFSGAAAGGHLGKTFRRMGTPFTKITIRMDARFDQLASTDLLTFLRLVDDTTSVVALVADTTYPSPVYSLQWPQGNTAEQNLMIGSATFHAIVLVVDYGSAAISLTVDGTGPVVETTTGLPASTTTISMSIGALGANAGASGTRRVHLDNVIVALE